MSRTLSNPDASNTSRRTMPLVSGGSGQTSASAALAALNGVPNSDYNQANGVVQLDSSGKLPLTTMPDGVSAGVSLTGPTLLYVGSKGVWSITNFDSALGYTVSCSAGFVTRADDKVYYTAPSIPGTYSFTINGKNIPITVDDRYVSKPTITSPVQDALMPDSGVIVRSSVFNVEGGRPEVSISAADKASGDDFGNISFTADGSRLAIGAHYKTVGGIAGAGQVYIYVKTNGVYTLEATISAADKAANDNFGVSTAFTADGTRLAIGAYQKTVGGLASAGQVYVYTRSGSVYTQEATIAASDKVAGDRFGRSVTFTDDGSRLAVGATNKTVGGISIAGQVYTYTRSGSVYTQEAIITASDKATNDSFGMDISYTSTGDRLVVGASGKTVSGISGAGQIYTYTRSGNVYTLETTITETNKAANNGFGYSVAFTSDGSRLGIGQYRGPNNGYTSSGVCYVYKRIGITYTLEQTVISTNPQTGDNFGCYCRFTADGSSLAVAANGRNFDGIISAGIVYIYDMSYHQSTDWQLSDDPGFSNIIQQSVADTTNLATWSISGLSLDTDYYIRCRYTGTQYGTSEWSDTQHIKTRSYILPTNEMQILTASDPESSSEYGISIAIDGTGNRLIIGSRTKDNGAVVDVGAAYVFLKTNGIWAQEAKLLPSDGVTQDYFGTSVGISSDGTRVLVTSASADPGGILAAGAAYVFSRSGSVWTQEAKLTASDKAANDNFGLSGTISGDGTRVIIGAYTANPGGIADAGAAYVFSRSGTTWTQEAILSASDKATNNIFGRRSSIDYTGTRVVIGSQQADPGGVANAGAAYVFVRSGTTWTQEQILTASDKVTNDLFGTSAIINKNGDRIAIGAYQKDSGGLADSGGVYIYSRSGSVWTEEAILSASDKAASDGFTIVSFNADASLLAVSAHISDPNGIVDAGAVYLFRRTGITWTQEAKLTASDMATYNYFGSWSDLTENGDTLIISAPSRTSNGVANAGAVYVFQ